MIGVELFSGVGGMSLGARRAGVDVSLAVEINARAASTFKQNHPEATVLTQDITHLESIEVDRKGGPAILFGGPPCQGFSLSNQKTRNFNNPQNWLFQEFIRLAGSWRPEWIVIENVSGLLKTEKGLFLKKILGALNDIGYKCSFKILNSVNFGVPQKRERIFIVGTLTKHEFLFPDVQSPRPITVLEALKDLPVLANGMSEEVMSYKSEPCSEYASELREGSLFSINNCVTRNEPYILERYEYIPQGGNWANVPDELMLNYKDHRRCHGWLYHRLNESLPSVVIGNYRKNMLVHPWENRGLSVREAARIQSFPDNFVFTGGLTEMQQQVANAVPPKLSESIFKEIIKFY